MLHRGHTIQFTRQMLFLMNIPVLLKEIKAQYVAYTSITMYSIQNHHAKAAQGSLRKSGLTDRFINDPYNTQKVPGPEMWSLPQTALTRGADTSCAIKTNRHVLH